MIQFTKRADIPSLLFAIVAILIVGILLFFSNHLTDALYGGLDDYLGNTTKYQNSEARESLQEIRVVENTYWDYATLAIMIGLMITLIGTAYSTRISPFFYWIYGFISMFALALGVIVSNMWQEIAANAEMASTISRFPITNAILGSYYPLIVTSIIMLMIIFLFGKNPGASNEI